MPSAIWRNFPRTRQEMEVEDIVDGNSGVLSAGRYLGFGRRPAFYYTRVGCGAGPAGNWPVAEHSA